MSVLIKNLTQQERINFLLTNRIPRRLLTRLMGWFSKIQSPFLTRISLKVWKVFAPELNLEEAKHQHFRSLHECFIRELKDDARAIDNNQDILISPCDGIIGSFGKINQTTVYQAKGFPYDLAELIPDESLRENYRNGLYITLRLKSTMYHRFHAPADCHLSKIIYISGDTWNVNPIALKRIEKLYCKNERAVVSLQLDQSHHQILMVPVAAILVASMKFHALTPPLNLQYLGPNLITCDQHYKKGDQLGYFEHGSTIILFVNKDFDFARDFHSGQVVNMGESLFLIKDLNKNEDRHEI